MRASASPESLVRSASTATTAASRGRVPVDAAGDGGEGDGLRSELVRYPERFGVAGGEEPAAVLPGHEHGPHGVDHPPGGEPSGGRGHGLAGWEAVGVAAGPQGAALGEDLGAAGPVDGAVDAAPAEQRRVGGVHDRVDGLGRDVALPEGDLHRRSLGRMYAERLARAREGMAAAGVDVLLLSLGADLPYFTGYEAMPLERLTMLVVPREGEATLLVPRLEAPRVVERPEAFRLLPWEETDDPVAMAARLAGLAPGGGRRRPHLGHVPDRPAGTAAQRRRGGRRRPSPRRCGRSRTRPRSAPCAGRRPPPTGWRCSSSGGTSPWSGRTEAEVSADLGRRLVDEGHARVNFAIVGSGPNAASPHHEAGARVIEPGEVVLCDFGGTMPDGYCSDTTRCVWTGGEVPAEFRDLYAVLEAAQAQAVDAAVVGTPCEDVDAVARRLITEGGYGPLFIHRVGHGIGLEEHEDPYLVGGNCTALVPGHAFSIEPGIYVEGRWGARIEDIVVATKAGPEALNTSDHALVVVEA